MVYVLNVLLMRSTNNKDNFVERSVEIMKYIMENNVYVKTVTILYIRDVLDVFRMRSMRDRHRLAD